MVFKTVASYISANTHASNIYVLYMCCVLRLHLDLIFEVSNTCWFEELCSDVHHLYNNTTTY